MKRSLIKLAGFLFCLALVLGLSLTAYADQYNIWVNGVRVKDDNRTDVLGDNLVIYQPADNDHPATLLLYDGANISYNGNDNGAAIYYSGRGELVIVLSGTNTVTSSKSDGIYSQNAGITISGNGTLNVSTTDTDGRGISINEGTITIEDGVTVNATGKQYGIDAPQVIINGGTVTVTETGDYSNSCAINTEGHITNSGGVIINGGTVTASGYYYAIKGKVKNTITGTGWSNKVGSGDGSTININSAGRTLSYKKIHLWHAHDYTYSASAATITATCSANQCTLPEVGGKHTATLTIAAPTMTYVGQTGEGISAAATLEGLDAFNAATGMNIVLTDIRYVGRDGTTYAVSATAPTGAGKYTAMLTLSGVKTSSGEDQSVTASVNYEIAVVSVTGVSLDQTALEVFEGGAGKAITATVAPADATDKTVHWIVTSGTDKMRLYFDADCTQEVGIAATDKLTVYAKGTAEGSATVTCTSNADNSIAADCDVTVSVPVSSIELDSTTINLGVNEGRELTATVLPDNAEHKTVTWSSSNEEIVYFAAVYSNIAVIRTNAAGEAIITATATNGTEDTADDKTATCTVKVHVHDYSVYSAAGATITAACSVESCTKTASMTIEAPALKVVGGLESPEAKITGSIPEVTQPAIVYKQDDTVLDAAPTGEGIYTASINVGGVTASVEYSIGTTVYPAWVGGIQVNNVNKDDVLGSIDAGATVKYTPAEGGAAPVLTLNGANITSFDKSKDAAVYAEGNLVINVKADSTVGVKGKGRGIYVNSNDSNEYDLTITGPGRLTVLGDYAAVSAKGSITFSENVTLNAESLSRCIQSDYDSVIIHGSVSACGGFNAIYTPNGTIKNFVAGTGWRSITSTGAGTPIKICPDGQSLDNYAKVHFHRHNIVYTADGATITATCAADGCTDPVYTATLSLAAAGGTYDGTTAYGAAITDEDKIQGFATVSYYTANADETRGTLIGSEAPVGAGKYWAEITLGEGTAAATAHTIYNVNKAATAAPSEDEVKLACTIDYASETAVPKDGYDVSLDGLTAVASPASFTAVLDGTGEKKIFVRISEKDNYSPSDWVAVPLTSRPTAPTGLTTENATNSTSQDGKIKGTTTSMEYSADDGKTWEDASTDETSVVPGTYLVRTKAESNAPYGKSAEVTVGDNLVEAKVAAQRELEAYRNSKDASAYDEEGITGLDSAKASGDAAIDKAADEAAVKAALAAAKEAIDAVKTKAQKKQEEDIAAAEAVKKLIDALPAAEKVVVSDKVTIEAARKAYDALTDAQKKLVNAETLKHLTDDEAALKTLIEADEKAKADVAAADAVKKLIDALSAADEVAVSDKDAIEVARKAYDALTDDQKKLIDADTLKHLTDDEAALKAAQEAEKAVQEKAKADQDAADTVKKLIDAMPAADKVVTGDKEAIEAARKAYDALTDDQKKLIDADVLKHLTDDETALKAAQEAEEKAKKVQAAADAVKKLIDTMPTADKVVTGDKEAIEAARKAYDALTDDQKKLIDADTLKHLTDEEEALNAAQEAEEKAKKDQAAATAVKALIDALPAADKVATGDKEAIEAARKAYDSLTDDQRKLISEDALKHLTDDEATLTELSADPVTAFVTRLYKLILGREPDEEGLKGWSDALKSKVATAAQIIDGFVRSPEFVQQNLGNGASVDILYRTMLDREADPEGKAGWTDAMDKGYTLQHIINGFCGSVEFNALCEKYGIEAGTISVSPVTPQNPRDKIEAFVRRCYQIILSREADEEGLKGWSDALEQRVAAAAQIIDGFIRSPEYINRNLSNDASVDILYRTMLDREADPAGKTGWVDALGQGYTLQHIINGFCGSAEFTAICDNYGIVAGSVAVSGAMVKREGITPEGDEAEAPVVYQGHNSEFINEEKIKAFVEHCYVAVFGREGDGEGVANYIALILDGKKTPKKVAYEFIFSPEFQNQLPGNEEFIRILYRLYFDREPGAEELAGWVQMLEDGASLEEIVNGFAGSAEFKAIVNAMKE